MTSLSLLAGKTIESDKLDLDESHLTLFAIPRTNELENTVDLDQLSSGESF